MSLFPNAKILELDASFAGPGTVDCGKAKPQLTTLRLEVAEEMSLTVVKSVKEPAKARFQKGIPLTKPAVIASEGMGEENGETAKKLWGGLRYLRS